MKVPVSKNKFTFFTSYIKQLTDSSHARFVAKPTYCWDFINSIWCSNRRSLCINTSTKPIHETLRSAGFQAYQMCHMLCKIT